MQPIVSDAGVDKRQCKGELAFAGRSERSWELLPLLSGQMLHTNVWVTHCDMQSHMHGGHAMMSSMHLMLPTCAEEVPQDGH